MAYRIHSLHSIYNSSSCFERDEAVPATSLEEIENPIKVTKMMDHFPDKSNPKRFNRQFYAVLLSNEHVLQLPKDAYVADWEYIE